jgi:hypothetical protein
MNAKARYIAIVESGSVSGENESAASLLTTRRPLLWIHVDLTIRCHMHGFSKSDRLRVGLLVLIELVEISANQQLEAVFLGKSVEGEACR